MTTTDAQKRAVIKYRKAHEKRFTIAFVDTNPMDMQAYNHLQQQSNKNGFVKGLIYKDAIKNSVAAAHDKKEKQIKEKN